MQQKSDLFIVRSLSMMNYLIRQGFDVMRIEDSYDNPYYKVFLFQNSRVLQKEVNKYLANQKGGTYASCNKYKKQQEMAF